MNSSCCTTDRCFSHLGSLVVAASTAGVGDGTDIRWGNLDESSRLAASRVGTQRKENQRDLDSPHTPRSADGAARNARQGSNEILTVASTVEGGLLQLPPYNSHRLPEITRALGDSTFGGLTCERNKPHLVKRIQKAQKTQAATAMDGPRRHRNLCICTYEIDGEYTPSIWRNWIGCRQTFGLDRGSAWSRVWRHRSGQTSQSLRK